MIGIVLCLIFIVGLVILARIEIKKAAIIDKDSLNKSKKSNVEKAMQLTKKNIDKSNESINKVDSLLERISNQLKKNKK